MEGQDNGYLNKAFDIVGKLAEKELKTDIGKLNYTGDILVFIFLTISVILIRDKLNFIEILVSAILFIMAFLMCATFVFLFDFSKKNADKIINAIIKYINYKQRNKNNTKQIINRTKKQLKDKNHDENLSVTSQDTKDEKEFETMEN